MALSEDFNPDLHARSNEQILAALTLYRNAAIYNGILKPSYEILLDKVIASLVMNAQRQKANELIQEAKSRMIRNDIGE